MYIPGFSFLPFFYRLGTRVVLIFFHCLGLPWRSNPPQHIFEAFFIVTRSTFSPLPNVLWREKERDLINKRRKTRERREWDRRPSSSSILILFDFDSIPIMFALTTIAACMRSMAWCTFRKRKKSEEEERRRVGQMMMKTQQSIKLGDEHRDLRVAVDGKINREMSFR